MIQTREEEARKAKIRIRFIRLHGEKAWMDFNYYVFKLGFSERQSAMNMKVSRSFIRYWKRKIQPNLLLKI